MSGIMSMLLGAVSAAVSTVDAFFNSVVLLLNTSSTNGAQNNEIKDSSSNNYSITRAPASGPNAPTQGTFTPFSQTGWSNFFNGSTDYLSYTTGGSSDFDLSTGNWTLEAWVYRAVAGVAHEILLLAPSVGSNAGLSFYFDSSNRLVIDNGVTGTTPVGSVLANTWTHVAAVRTSGNTQLYINGVATGAVITQAASVAQFLYVGRAGTAVNYMNGYLSNVRIVKGQALASGSFTPPTSPLTTTTVGWTGANAATTLTGSVSLLTCQSNRFVTNSSNGIPLTANGTPSVQAFSPFVPGIPYSTSAIGGSGYFDGSGDYLTVANATPLQFESSSFTINCWIYRNAAGAIHTIASKGTSSTGWSFQVTAANVLQFTTGTSTNTTGTKVIPANTWTYVTVTRDATVPRIDLYINGVFEIATFPTLTNFNQANVLNIGANRTNPPTINFFNGYISGFEYIKGSAISPTVPTAPPVKETRNPSLLLNFTNAGIYDAASKLNIETVGTAQASTTETKFGATSLFINGAGNYLLMPSTQATRFGSANWTIEFFFRTTSASTRQVILSWNAISSGFAACSVNFLANGKIGLQISESGSAWKFDDTTTGLGSALSANTWYYLAVTRSGATVTVYIDGSSIGTYTLTSATQTLMTTDTRNVIGINPDLTNQPFSGYIDEVRVTNGVARTITTPTDAFPVQ
jgi:hypothetical protein